MNATRAGVFGTVAALCAATLVTAGGAAEAAPAPLARAAAPRAASGVGAPNPRADELALAFVRSHRGDYGLSAADVADLVVSSTVPTAANGLTNVYLQQRYQDIDVFNAMLNVAVESDGSIFQVASTTVADAAAKVDATAPSVGATEAARKAATALGLQKTASFSSDDAPEGADQQRDLGSGGIAQGAVPVQLVYVPADDGSLQLTWNLGVDQVDGEHWWQIRMSASTGQEVDRNDWVAYDGYNVNKPPLEAPSFGLRTLVTNPASATASPFGWHDTNGAAGAEYTVTRGNNAYAYTDTDNNNQPDTGSSPDGGAGLLFDFPLDLTQAPSTYRPAAVTNLFFANNYMHDVFYGYGFDEAAGNFQTNNYGHGGAGSDAVNAEAQDGGGTNNANFATPVDGSSPRMQMYVFNQTTPNRDGDLDDGVIMHEYGHGISNRLTGGPANSSCLNNVETGGEGWSDYFALVLTQTTPTETPGGRGMGTYVLGQPTNGAGIRNQKYSTDLTINNETYTNVKTTSGGETHNIGEVWAEMLYELNWGMVAKYGYTDIANAAATGGNNRTLRLVVDGLKLQKCSPGFVDSRDAILAADQADYAGADTCRIWRAFAKRGLGVSATQGSSASYTDGVAAFDVPNSCVVPQAPTATGSATGPTTAQVALSTTDDGNTPIASYAVTCTGGGSAHTATGATSPVAVTGLSPGTAYTCTGAATNAGGSGPVGPSSNAFTTPATAPASPGGVSVAVKSATKAKVSFAAAVNGGSPVTSYTATCTSSNKGKTATASGPATTLTVKKLTEGKKYTCTVTATNAVGTSPASAASASFKAKAHKKKHQGKGKPKGKPKG